MRRFGAIVAVAFAFCASRALAADEFVYVVNGTGEPVRVMIDGRVFPPIDHLMALNVRLPPGEHMIAAGFPRPIAAGEIKSAGTSISKDLTPEAGIVDEQKRTFWCFIVGKQSDGALRIISPDLPTCAELIRRGVGERPLK